MKRLSKEQILILHSQIIEQTVGMVGAAADGSLEYEDMLRWVLEHQDYKKGETEWQEFLMKKT